MSVASAWSLVPKWFCQTVAMPCALIATAIGMNNLVLP